tara:strand:- start:543 stop:2381 length:1839 start_codon:yes stop_codon:yes gene_type:complete
MRNLRNSWMGIVLVILFGISLIFWRQSSYISDIFNSDTVVAKVGKTPVSTTRFNRAFQMNIQQFNQILGKELDGDEIRNYQIHQLALNAIVNESVFENEFNELNFVFDEEIIAKKTKEMIPELYKNNELDEKYLDQFLYEQKLKVEDLVQIVHYDSRKNYFESALLNFNFPNNFSNKIRNYNNHEREIEFVILPIDLINIDIKLNINKDELNNNIQDYYNKNLSKYYSNEKRSVRYIEINKNDLIKDFAPNENEIIDYYNNNKNLFIQNEKRSFIQFNFKEKSKAESFNLEIEKFKTHQEIIEYANKINLKFNTFEELEKNEVLDEIGDSLFNLELNEKSKVIKSPLANHIIVLKNIIPIKNLSFNESKNNIIKLIAESDANNYFIDLENQISEDIIDGLNIINISEKNNLKLLNINDLTMNFKSENEKKLLYESIKLNSFNADKDYTNDIVKINNDIFYIYEVTEIIEAKPIDYIEIKDTVFHDWKKSIKIDQIINEIESNNTKFNFLNNIENKYKLEKNNISIKQSHKNLPKNLIKNIFNSKINDVIYNINEEDIYIGKLNNIKIDNKIKEEESIVNINNEIRETLYNDLLKETEISTNDRLINAILNSY